MNGFGPYTGYASGSMVNRRGYFPPISSLRTQSQALGNSGRGDVFTNDGPQGVDGFNTAGFLPGVSFGSGWQDSGSDIGQDGPEFDPQAAGFFMPGHGYASPGSQYGVPMNFGDTNLSGDVNPFSSPVNPAGNMPGRSTQQTHRLNPAGNFRFSGNMNIPANAVGFIPPRSDMGSFNADPASIAFRFRPDSGAPIDPTSSPDTGTSQQPPSNLWQSLMALFGTNN